jgi:hypothetical protein
MSLISPLIPYPDKMNNARKNPHQRSVEKNSGIENERAKIFRPLR